VNPALTHVAFGVQDLDRTIAFFTGPRIIRQVLWDAIIAHQIHHRGQVHAMLAGTRVAPPQLDEFFLREELPLRAHELDELGLPHD